MPPASRNIAIGKPMRLKYHLLPSILCIAFGTSLAVGQQQASPTGSSGTLSVEQVIDSAIEQENALTKRLATLRPLIETYTQNLERHPGLGVVPAGDKYFLGKLDLSRGLEQKSLLPNSGWISTLGQPVKQAYSVAFVPDGF